MLLNRESARALGEIFPFFLRLRLRAQLAARNDKQALDHHVDLAKLSEFERRHMKDAFVIIKRIQEDLRARFGD